jgi:cyclin-dependent kinase regulatory subunit CKS1
MSDIDPARRNKKPRLLQEGERARLDEFIDSIGYSARSVLWMKMPVCSY